MDYPLRFQPILQERVWGGECLARRAGRAAAGPVGESWEIVDHGADASRVRNGPLAGRTLRELLREAPVALAGEAANARGLGRFPLLLKLIDARERLSVQVHPDDAQAAQRAPGELGKTEAWYILEADPGATIWQGVRPGVTRDSLRRALERGTLEECLGRFEAAPDRVFFLPAGTVHALGGGVRLAEIQETSDITYRLFDWNRAGLDGRPRPLQVEEALAVLRLESGVSGPRRAEACTMQGCMRERFVASEKFCLERLSAFQGTVALDTGNRSFHILTAIHGPVTVRAPGGAERLERWESALLPAACGRYGLEGGPGSAALLFYVPERR
ncbi:MAG: type I phosphomannose isomerase catalytic subunit [Planctomycetota bacterium]